INGVERHCIARLNPNGSLDGSFNASIDSIPIVYAIKVQPDGKIVVGGSFTSIAGVARNRVARLNSDGSLDTTFNPGAGANDTVMALAIQPDGEIIIGGAFTSVNGLPRNRLAGFNLNGSVNGFFTPD